MIVEFTHTWTAKMKAMHPSSGHMTTANMEMKRVQAEGGAGLLRSPLAYTKEGTQIDQLILCYSFLFH